MLALVALVSCGENKNEPAPNPEPKKTPGLMIVTGDKQYYSGETIVLNDLLAEIGPKKALEVKLSLPVRPTDKSYAGDNYSVRVEKLSHLSNKMIGMNSVCMNICPDLEGIHDAVTLPLTEEDPKVTVYPADDKENESQNNLDIHYQLTEEELAKKGQKYELKVTLKRGDKEVYSARVIFTAKK